MTLKVLLFFINLDWFDKVCSLQLHVVFYVCYYMLTLLSARCLQIA